MSGRPPTGERSAASDTDRLADVKVVAVPGRKREATRGPGQLMTDGRGR